MNSSILLYSWHNILFGHGNGGHFTDAYFEFNKYIGKYDFSEQEIQTRNFYNPYNLAYNFLKFGILWQMLLLFLLHKTIKQTTGDIRMFFGSFTVYIIFKYGLCYQNKYPIWNSFNNAS